MKKFFAAALSILFLACNNQAGNDNNPGNDSTKSNDNVQTSTDGGCGNSLLFKKGAVIQATNYDGQGKETGKQESIVTNVSSQDGMTVAELDMRSSDPNGGDEKTFKAIYKCDGKQLYMDLSGMMPDSKEDFDMEASGLQFPFNPTVGEALPDFNYSTNVSSGGKTMKISSHIKDRKVEGKESVTTPAGTFECYKISSVIEAETEMPGLDATSKKIMDEMKKKMGKNVMTFWYAPDVTIIKMEFRMGDKLITRTEVTSIKN